MEITEHRHRPSGSFLQTVMYLPSAVRSFPVESGAVIRFVPYVYPKSPLGEMTAESGVQEMWKPGMAELACGGGHINLGLTARYEEKLPTGKDAEK